MKMRILIQNCTSHLFLAPNKEWTMDDTKALTFKSTPKALDACLKRPAAPLQIVLKFDKPSFDVSLPVRESGCP